MTSAHFTRSLGLILVLLLSPLTLAGSARAMGSSVVEDRIFYSGCPVPIPEGRCTDSGRRVRTEILSILPDASNIERITTNNRFEQSLVWSPSKETVVFSKGTDSFGCGFDSVLAVVASSGGDETNLTQTAYRCDTPTDWSEDGRKILYEQECALCRDVYSIKPDGSRKRALTHFYDRGDPDIYAGAGRWLEDKVMYMLNDYPERTDRLTLMNADGSDKHRYGAKGLRGGAFDVSINDEVAFVLFDQDRVSDLYVGDPTGENIHPVATGFIAGINDVRWSPDGTKILFAGKDGGGVGSLYVVNRDGTGLTKLDSEELNQVSTREIYGGYWSPDSTQIAFGAESTDNQSHALAVMDADGSNVHLLTDYERHLWVWGWEPTPE